MIYAFLDFTSRALNWMLKSNVHLNRIFYAQLSPLRQRFLTLTYSQFGEDIIIYKISDVFHKSNGCYVDVGCNHPVKYSNTFGLYLRGWRGLCIDGNPALIRQHEKMRKGDVQICALISNTVREVSFHLGNHHEVSTISEDFSSQSGWKYASSEKRTTTTINAILEEHPLNAEIDLLSIDVEGHDYEALQSIDLEKYRPKVILVETHSFPVADGSGNEIHKYLENSGYEMASRVSYTSYFIRRDFCS